MIADTPNEAFPGSSKPVERIYILHITSNTKDSDVKEFYENMENCEKSVKCEEREI